MHARGALQRCFDCIQVEGEACDICVPVRYLRLTECAFVTLSILCGVMLSMIDATKSIYVI